MPHETQTFRTNFPFLYVRIKIRRDFANLSFILVQMAHFMSYRRFVIKDACFSRVLCHMRINDSILSQQKSTLSPGGALGYFLGGYVPPGTPNWHPVLKTISPKIDTPF